MLDLKPQFFTNGCPVKTTRHMKAGHLLQYRMEYKIIVACGTKGIPTS